MKTSLKVDLKQVHAPWTSGYFRDYILKPFPAQLQLCITYCNWPIFIKLNLKQKTNHTVLVAYSVIPHHDTKNKSNFPDIFNAKTIPD